MHFQELIENRKEELVSRLQECIRIPSVYREDESGYPYGAEVHRCLQYMLEVAGAMGFETHNMDNQVGWCEYGNGEEMVAVLGHLDVVPEGDGWSVPPFEGLVKDGKIYGRGTMDDKGPTMAALFGLLAIKETGLPVNRRIRLIFGLNEETGSADMKYYAAHGGEIPVMGFTPDGEYPVINGEKGLVNETYRCEFTQERFRNTAKGTTEKSVQSNVLLLKELWGGTAHNIVPNHAYAEFVCESELAQEVLQKQTDKCVCTATADGIRIEAEGIGAHGGTPWEGENAIGRLMQFLAELPLGEELKRAVCFLAEKLGMEYDGAGLGIAMEDAVSGILTMNLGTIRGGEDYLEVKLNYRYPVTKSFADCGPQVCEAFLEAGFEQIMSGHKACLYMSPESELVQKLMKVYTDCTGEMAEPKSIGGGTYAKMLPNVLAFGPIFPGDEVREHKPDEFMEISRLIDNANILAEAMYSLACE